MNSKRTHKTPVKVTTEHCLQGCVNDGRHNSRHKRLNQPTSCFLTRVITNTRHNPKYKTIENNSLFKHNKSLPSIFTF